MDGRGRLVGSLAYWGAVGHHAGPQSERVSRAGIAPEHAGDASVLRRSARVIMARLVAWEARLPALSGAAASLLLVAISLGYGMLRGDHVTPLLNSLNDARNAAANAAGFRLASVSLEGNRHVRRAEILAAAGVTEEASLPFLDVEAARSRLKAIPWIADATVRKFYPDRLLITVTEREPFALWQLTGQVSVIAADGTVVAALNHAGFAGLPLVVGPGAARKAGQFLPLLERYPQLRDQVRASILVAERRWNLRLKNGLDVRLPELDIDPALQVLAKLDRDHRLLSRDIISIDLRLPDRVTVRLPAEAAQARAESQKDKPAKRKGGDA
jgi:cell division protein FtsQ